MRRGTCSRQKGSKGASLRAIATRAGYTPAALYFHFDSKEAIYAEVLRRSLASLGDAVDEAVAKTRSPKQKLHAAAMSFFRFYAENPRDLDLGFYLFRGGMKPAGLGHDRDVELNAALEAALRPIAEAATALGASRQNRQHADGRLLRARYRLAPAASHRPYPNVRRSGSRSHGCVYPRQSLAAE